MRDDPSPGKVQGLEKKANSKNYLQIALENIALGGFCCAIDVCVSHQTHMLKPNHIMGLDLEMKPLAGSDRPLLNEMSECPYRKDSAVLHCSFCWVRTQFRRSHPQNRSRAGPHYTWDHPEPSSSWTSQISEL